MNRSVFSLLLLWLLIYIVLIALASGSVVAVHQIREKFKFTMILGDANDNGIFSLKSTGTKT